MVFEASQELLIPDQLSDEQSRQILTSAGLVDWRSARRSLQRLASGNPRLIQTLGDFLPYLLAGLSTSADPDHVLGSFERFAGSIPEPLDRLELLDLMDLTNWKPSTQPPTRPDRLALFRSLAENPRAVDMLVTLFSSSQFLTEILLRRPEYFQHLVRSNRLLLARPKTAGQYFEDAMMDLATRKEMSEKLDALRRFQRLELLRIGLADLLGQYDLLVVTQQLSNLADSMLRACLSLSAQQTHYIDPPAGFAVLAMGKLGGRELNYSSDIDLLFISDSDDPPYRKLGERLIDALAGTTDEGFLYRVDMRLRPWGKVGSLVTSLRAYQAYLEHHARLWEKQAMLKARPVAGDESLAEAFLRQVNDQLYRLSAEDIRAEVHAMKQRTEAQLRQSGRQWGEVKLGEGSIRDIEFVVQYLQMAYGARQPEIRSRNTLEALRRLFHYQLLSSNDYLVLSDGYIFLRTIEHHLQMMDYRQAHNLPDDPAAIAHLSRRLGFQGSDAGEQFLTRYLQHSAAIRSVYMRFMGDPEMESSFTMLPPTPEVQRHIERMDPSYEATFSPQDIQRHATMAARLELDHLVEVQADSLEDGRWRVTVVAFDYPGELALLCGLMFVYGLDILDGNVFTYEPDTKGKDTRRKIVDAFTVRPVDAELPEGTWTRYANDLADLLKLMQAGKRQEARGLLAKRVAGEFQNIRGAQTPLYPIDLEIDNESSEHYTVLRIDAPDTVGFLYEFTTALAFYRIYIARMLIDSTGQRVRDVLYVTDADGQKILDPAKQRELRAATVLIKHFTHLLPHTPDAESALLHFREFIFEMFRRPNWPDELASLENPEVLAALAQVLGVSEFLWDDFLRMQYANLFPVVTDVGILQTAKSRHQLQAELEAALLPVHNGPLPPSDDAPWRTVLNDFKDREMLRIDMRHILGHTKEFWEFAEELTDLAEVVVNAAYHLAAEDLRLVYGVPCLENGQVSQMAVCALGKCGGSELGFASDIELMFVYAGNGKTTGPALITTAEFYEKVVESFLKAIRAKREGIFEVDLQLRPYGKNGSLSVSLESFRRYFSPEGPAWPYERQALIKLRPIAGDAELGMRVAALRDQFVYTGEKFDVTAMHAMRERQMRHLVKGGTFNLKFSPGGLVDVEYLVQGLQITYGFQNPDLRCTNTRQAMAALAKAGILSPEDYTGLRKAHTFLRWMIDGVRVVAGNARDLVVPAENSEAFAFLARRLRYGNQVDRLRKDLYRHTSFVLDCNRRLLG